MIQTMLQIIAALALLGLAIRVRVSLHRRTTKSWESTLRGFRNGHKGLAELAEEFDERQSGGDASQLPIQKLWMMMTNLRVIIGATEYLAYRFDGNNELMERLCRPRASASRAQWTVLFCMVQAAVGIRLRSQASKCVFAYIDPINELYSALYEFCPTLLRSYRYFVTRDRLRAAL